MAITVRCNCGKMMSVSDALAGKSVRCPKCGNPVAVIGIGGTKSRVSTFAQSQAPAIYISKGKIVFLSVLAGIALFIFISLVGPIRVYKDWNAREPHVNDDVSDVIAFALKAYLSQNGGYDPKFQHMAPAVEGPCVFLGPIISFSMPERIPFRGKTNQGNFMGTYNTRTGDIDADIYYGGYSVAGMLDISKPTGSFHITGRMDKGFPEAELNGTSLQIYTPPSNQ
jgi:hypothetical protein